MKNVALNRVVAKPHQSTARVWAGLANPWCSSLTSLLWVTSTYLARGILLSCRAWMCSSCQTCTSLLGPVPVPECLHSASSLHMLCCCGSCCCCSGLGSFPALVLAVARHGQALLVVFGWFPSSSLDGEEGDLQAVLHYRLGSLHGFLELLPADDLQWGHRSCGCTSLPACCKPLLPPSP